MTCLLEKQFRTYVGDTQRSKVVALEFAAHSLARRRATLAQMRWHVSTSTTTESTSSLRTVLDRSHVDRRRILAGGSHGVLEGTLGGKVVSGTNTTLDLHLLERVGLLVLLGCLLLLAAGLEANHGLEHDVLTERGGVSGTRRLAGLQTDLGPCAALGDARVLLLLDDGAADALRALDLLAVLVDENRHDRLGAVLVLRDLGRGDGGGKVGLAVLGPVDGFLCVCRHLCVCRVRVSPSVPVQGSPLEL